MLMSHNFKIIIKWEDISIKFLLRAALAIYTINRVQKLVNSALCSSHWNDLCGTVFVIIPSRVLNIFLVRKTIFMCHRHGPPCILC